MKKTMIVMALVGSFLMMVASMSIAATDHEGHHPGEKQPAATSSSSGMHGSGMHGSGMHGSGMHGSGMHGSGMHGSGMHGSGMHGSGMHGSGMHGSGMHGSGKMACQSSHSFFLDQEADLGLSAEQIAKLKAIRSNNRKESIRTSAEVKIGRLELAELLDGNDWSLKDAEELIRKSKKLEGDIQVRQLKAQSDARKVLTKEQLEKTNSGGISEELEKLFQ